jgi:hypothetical protein
MPGPVNSISIDTVDLIDGCHVQMDCVFKSRREAEQFTTVLHQVMVDLVKRMGANIVRNEAEHRRIILPQDHDLALR